MRRPSGDVPIEDVVSRFNAVFSPRCAAIITELKRIQSKNPTPSVAENITDLEGLFENLVKMDIPNIQKILDGKVSKVDAILHYNQISNDIIEFRRSADSAVIELLAVGRVTAKDKIFAELRLLREHDRYFSLRFAKEKLLIALETRAP